jgi:hypothetical protein
MLRAPAGFSSWLRCAVNRPFEQALAEFGTAAAKQQGRKKRGVERNPNNSNNTQN